MPNIWARALAQQGLQTQQQQRQLMQTILPTLIKSRIQQQDPYRQMQMQMMQRFFGAGAPTTIGPLGQPIKPGVTPTPQPSQFITKPSLTLGPTGPSIGFTQIEDPEIARRQAQLNVASGLRKEFNAARVSRNYETISRSAKALEQAYKLSTRPDMKSRVASDQALAVLFQKMLDPASVVRESEYARTPEGAAAINRILAFVPQLRRGGLRLTNEDRYAIYEQAQRLLQEAQRTYNVHIDRYTNISQMYGVDPKLIFGGIKKVPITEFSVQPLPSPGQPGVNTQLDMQINQLLDQLGAPK